jgi:hypothetical protein
MGEKMDDNGVSSSFTDEEKTPTRVTDGRIGDQIPHEMLEELAPNGETSYILDKINDMSEEDAVAIVKESRKTSTLYKRVRDSDILQSQVPRRRLEFSRRDEVAHASTDARP